MNAPASVTPIASPGQGAKLSVNQAVVRGKIIESRMYERVRYTRILCPASDEFSRPETLQIRSKSQLGQRDEIVMISVSLGGYARKAFRVTDKETGETSSITPIEMTLDAIE
jgi:hypothetical protein